MRLRSATLCLLLTTPLVCLADDGQPVTPYRPTASSPASLPAAGQLELELAGARRGGTSSSAQVLAAAAYSPHPRLTVDGGVARGLNRATPPWAWFTGLVLPIANF